MPKLIMPCLSSPACFRVGHVTTIFFALVIFFPLKIAEKRGKATYFAREIQLRAHVETNSSEGQCTCMNASPCYLPLLPESHDNPEYRILQ